MSLMIALLTPGTSPEESRSTAAGLSSRLGGTATILPFDPFSEEGRLGAQQVLTTGRVDLALSSEAGFDPHVLSKAKVPVIVVARSPDMLWTAADVVASLRVRGVNASMATSWDDAVERIQTVLSPSVLAGKKVLIFSEPFDSATLPSRNLSREYVLEDIARRPSFLGNVGTVDVAVSTTDMLHCVVPLKMEEYETEPAPYRLRD